MVKSKMKEIESYLGMTTMLFIQGDHTTLNRAHTFQANSIKEYRQRRGLPEIITADNVTQTNHITMHILVPAIEQQNTLQDIKMSCSLT